MESKRTHFKMYKIGRKWAFACAVLLTLGGASVTVKADTATNSSSSESSAVSSSQSSSVASSSSSAAKQSSVASSSSSQRSSSSSSQTSSSTATDQQAGTDGTTQTSSANKTTTAQNTANQSKNDATSKQASASNSSAVSSSSTSSTTETSSSSASSTKDTTTIASDDNTDSVQSVSPMSVSLNADTTTFKTFKNSFKANVSATTNDAVADGGSVYDDYPNINNILGISSQFHIFANEAELNAHTNGNIAVGTLIGNVNFGTNIIEELLDKDISYIQNITNIANSSFVSAGDTRVNKVIFGEGIEIDVSNPNRPMVNGVYIDHLLAEEVYQDKNGNVYIDFEKEFAALKKTNEALSEITSNASYTNSDFDDMNNRVIDVTDMTPNANGEIVINLSADMLTSGTPLTIKGVSSTADGPTIVINVDTEGQADYTVTSQIKVVLDDGTDRNNQETEDFGDNHLLWNFYDSTASDKQYAGTITIDRPFQGSILAPSAEVVANQNVDGNIIANKVVVNAETHRWDLQDPTKPDTEEPETPGTEEPENPEPEKPGTEEPEEPEPEKPGTEEPESPEPEKPSTEEPEEPEDSEDPNTAVPNEETPEEPEEEEHLYSEDYDKAVEESFEDELDQALALPKDEQLEAEEALLSKLDAAIAKAKAAGDQALVTKLEALRARIIAAFKAAGVTLPQTDEAQNHTAQLMGLVLASVLTLGGFAARRKRRN